jgi:hypothetical protein
MNQRRECRPRARLGYLLLLLAALLAPPAALAAKDSKDREPAHDEIEGKQRAAKTACLAGDYAKGVAILAELFVSTNNATYLFNQARCFEQNGRYADAVTRFREYQRKTRSAGKPADEEADRHIAECEALLEKEKGPPASVPAPNFPVAQPVIENRQPAVSPGVAPPAAVPPPAVVVQSSAEPSTPGSGLRIAGIATMAVGALGVGAGVLLNLKANDLASELGSSPTSFDRGKASDRSSYETAAWLGYGVGATCVVGGAVLYYLGHRQGQPTTSMALLPMVAQGQYGAVMQGGF